ncbi:MAG: protein translocase subunit SecF [Gemmatimonadota bacterium]
MRLFKDASFEFLRTRKVAYVVSSVLLAVGIATLIARGGPSYGVEFTGGTLMQVELAEATTVAELRDGLVAEGLEGAQIQGFGSEREYMVRIPTFEATEDRDVVADLRSALDAVVGAEGYDVIRTEAVGPKVGGELQTKALSAILLSFVLTLVYLAFRFEWRFGVAAVTATVHDILLTFGFIAVFDVEITLATVAAILTIVGYSLNDTIVTFDRMRENLQKKRKEEYEPLLNRSINEVLPRTVMTSVTTLGALVALYAFGGRVIRPFALVLILGVVVGTYSSIWVASPALLEIDGWLKRRSARRAQAATS